MLVRRLDEPTQLRFHPERLEIIACDRIAVDTPRRVTPAQSRLTISIKAGQLAEGGVSLPKVFKRGIRRSKCFTARPRLEAKLVEILRVADIQRVKQDRIDYSEDDDVRPDPQHQSDQGYKRECGRLPQHAQRI